MGEIPAIFGTYNTTKTNSKKSKNPAKNINTICLNFPSAVELRTLLYISLNHKLNIII